MTTAVNLNPMHTPPSREAGAAIDPHYAWSRVLARDPAAAFVYAVRTTGIFCRPSCPSRRPSPANVDFFQTAADAIQHGFRPCLRCRPLAPADKQDAALVQQVCEYLVRHHDRAVTLNDLGRLTAMKPMTLQRKFHQLLGMTPRQFQINQRVSRFRNLMTDPQASPSAGITAALYDAGYSASSRLYTGAQQKLGMTPARFRDGGRGGDIVFATTPCILGYVLAAATPAGICSVALGDSPDLLEAELRHRFRHASTLQNSTMAGKEQASLLQQALRNVLSQLTNHPITNQLPLDLRATLFQQRVWQALAAIPRGCTKSYREVACDLGQPTASRAVARACASNPVALLIPCHRVIGTDGSLSGYRWGLQRKQAVLAVERHKEPGETS